MINLSTALSKSLKNGKAWVIIMMLIGAVLTIGTLIALMQFINFRTQCWYHKALSTNKIFILICKYESYYLGN